MLPLIILAEHPVPVAVGLIGVACYAWDRYVSPYPCGVLARWWRRRSFDRHEMDDTPVSRRPLWLAPAAPHPVRHVTRSAQVFTVYKGGRAAS